MQNCNSKLGTICGAVIGVPVTFALEVLGATGAIWGASEAFHLRNESNVNTWNAVALTFAAFGLARYVTKYTAEPTRPSRHKPTFFSAFCHTIVSPHEGIKDEFFANSNRITEPLLQ